MEENKLSPQEYFDIVKEKKHQVSDEQLRTIYDNCLELLNKYITTGQKREQKSSYFIFRVLRRSVRL